MKDIDKRRLSLLCLLPSPTLACRTTISSKQPKGTQSESLDCDTLLTFCCNHRRIVTAQAHLLSTSCLAGVIGSWNLELGFEVEVEPGIMAIRKLLWGVTVVALLVCMLSVVEGSHVNLGTISRLAKFTRKEARVAKINLCDTCLQLSQEAQMVLADPDTAKQVINVADQLVCSPLQPGIKKKCERIVDQYVPQVILELEARLGPDKLCFESGLCTATALNAFEDEGKSCTVCQDLATDALTYLESNRTRGEIVIALHLACAQLKELSKQCDLLVDLYTPRMMEQLENITPQEFCQMTKMCKPAKRVLASNDCATCQFVILELKIKLQDPKTQEKVLDVLMNGCNRVVNHVDECKALVVQYGPFILANLDKILDSQAVCCKAGFCKSGICPEKAKVWTEMMTELSQKDAPLIELPQEGLVRTV